MIGKHLKHLTTGVTEFSELKFLPLRHSFVNLISVRFIGVFPSRGTMPPRTNQFKPNREFYLGYMYTTKVHFSICHSNHGCTGPSHSPILENEVERYTDIKKFTRTSHQQIHTRVGVGSAPILTYHIILIGAILKV